MKKIVILIILTLFSCNKSNKKENQAIEIDTTISEKKAKNNEPTVFIDTLSFVEYNDDGDNYLFFARKNNEIINFINNDSEDRSYLNGDIIEIKWRKDTIQIPDDTDSQNVEKIVSTKKIKDGAVSIFRKKYKKELKYHWSTDEEYSQNYLDKLYLIVEYYIANSKNEMIKHYINKGEQLEYSIEKQTRDGKEYTVLGISHTFENRTSTLKWLYFYSEENQKLYEYDLPNDKLIEFK